MRLRSRKVRRRGEVVPDLVGVTHRVNISVITAGSYRCVRGRSDAIRGVLLYVRAGQAIGSDSEVRFGASRFCLGARSRVHRIFTDCPRTVSGARGVTSVYGISFRFNMHGLPEFSIPGGRSRLRCFEEGYCRKLCGRCNRGPTRSLVSQLRCRVGAISRVNFMSCCLVMGSFMDCTGSYRVPIKPNENSNTNSLYTCYVNVATVSPVGCGLLFREFLGPREIDVPSFSISFYGRHEKRIVSCIIHGCNRSRITRVVSFNAVTTENTVQSIKEILRVPCTAMSSITGLIPVRRSVAVRRTLGLDPSLEDHYGGSPRVGGLLSITVDVRKVPHRTAVRTTNIMVASGPIDSCIPLSGGSSGIMARFAVATLRRLNLLGVSFLKLEGLAMVGSTRGRVGRGGPSCGPSVISRGSGGIFRVFSGKCARNIFRFRDRKVGGILARLGPRQVRSLVTIATLCHPKPVSDVPICVSYHRGPSRVHCGRPLLGRVLKIADNYVVCRRRIVRVFEALTNCDLNETSVIHHTVDGGGLTMVRSRHRVFVRNLASSSKGVVIRKYVHHKISRGATVSICSRVRDFTRCTFGGSRTTTCTGVSCGAT